MNELLTLSKRAILHPYVSREPIPFTLATDDEIYAGAGGVLIADTETYINYHLLQFRNVATKKVIQLELPYNRQKLSWIMHSYLVVGFNLIKYDLPIIWCGYKYQDLEMLNKLSREIVYNNTWPRQLQKDFDFTIHKTNIIDLIEICPGIHSLKLYMGRLHSERLQDLPFPIDKPLSNDQIEIVKDYCHNDIIGTEQLFLFNKDRIQLREELGHEYQTDLRSKSDAQMAEAMVASEIKKKTGYWPKKADLTERRSFHYDPPSYMQFATPQLQKLFSDVRNVEFIAQHGELAKPELFQKYYFRLGKLTYKFGIGGLHSCEENVSYQSNSNNLLIDRDVASYYPAIIINQGLYPKHLGSVFIEVYTKMRDDRIRAKKLKQFAKDKGLKIALNGVSGKFNSEYSIFYDPRCYLQMTLTGQLSILMLAEMFECCSIQVVSANTDGIVLLCPHSKYEEMLRWIDYWEKATGFVTEETRYKSYYAQNVNAYFAVKNDGVKVKGPYSEIGSQTGTKLDNNPIALICSDAVKALIAHNIPIEKTIRECKDLTRFITVRNVASPGAHKNGHYLGKVIRWIYHNDIVGTINYISNGNKVPQTEGAMPIQDLPPEWPDINYQYYIEKTIEILYDVAYLKRVEQERLI